MILMHAVCCILRCIKIKDIDVNGTKIRLQVRCFQTVLFIFYLDYPN